MNDVKLWIKAAQGKLNIFKAKLYNRFLEIREMHIFLHGGQIVILSIMWIPGYACTHELNLISVRSK